MTVRHPPPQKGILGDILKNAGTVIHSGLTPLFSQERLPDRSFLIILVLYSALLTHTYTFGLWYLKTSHSWSCSTIFIISFPTFNNFALCIFQRDHMRFAYTHFCLKIFEISFYCHIFLLLSSLGQIVFSKTNFLPSALKLNLVPQSSSYLLSWS